jgi:3'-5' exoribonuclease
MVERIWIESLQTGQNVEGVFAVSSSSLRNYSGGEFISLRLADRTGKVAAVFWDGNQNLFKQVQAGAIVKIKGKMGKYRGAPQLQLNLLAPVGPEDQYDETDFLPVSPVDVETLFNRVKEWKDSLENEHYRQLWEIFLQDQDAQEKFRFAPAAKLWHHSYLAGLLEHTTSLIELCSRFAEQYPFLNRDLLLSGALFHDIGKIEELSTGATFDYTDEGRLIGHTYMSLFRVREYLKQIPEFPKEEVMLLQHLILSHHGDTPESPRLPRCREALALHMADLLDSQMAGYTREMEKPDAEGRRWTPYVNLISRHLYRGTAMEERDSDKKE